MTTHPMPARTLAALKASIQHWQRLSTGKRHPGEDIGGDNCALCHLFWFDRGCRGCPVSAKTGFSDCEGTPYGNTSRARHRHGLDSPQFRAAAKLELAFLRSLLPKGKK
jgi:hypothetical protein